MEEAKQFKVSNVTVTDPNDYINRSNVTYETTWDILNTRLLDTLGGYLWVRHEADGVYLDYLADFPYTSGQRITFGENLLDYSQTRSGDEIITALLPLGAKRLGFDPAVMASPLITTIVDALSLLIYFQMASWLLAL